MTILAIIAGLILIAPIIIIALLIEIPFTYKILSIMAILIYYSSSLLVE